MPALFLCLQSFSSLGQGWKDGGPCPSGSPNPDPQQAPGPGAFMPCEQCELSLSSFLQLLLGPGTVP